MKASEFIKVALIDQMQQIADFGLWLHLAKLIPSGVELLGRVANPAKRFVDDGLIFLPDRIEDIVKDIYEAYFPAEYTKEGYPTGKDFFSVYPKTWLCHEDETLHFQKDEIGRVFIHVPTWFLDFKNACQSVLEEIESGKIKDIEVLKMFDE